MPGRDVLAYWLGERNEIPPTPERVARWFTADPRVDEEIRERFGDRVERALEGGLVDWELDSRSRVALVVLLDQFPRNLFREDARGFAGDPRARDLVRRTTAQELDRLHPLERYFLLLPWMHSESIDDQRLGEAAYAEAASDLPEAFRPLFESGGDFATRHRRVIERFGRFPHRNAVLGRESTPEELAFMEAYGTGF